MYHLDIILSFVNLNCFFQVARVTSDIQRYDAHHVISGHEYYFRVSAENDFGKSDPCVTNTAVRAISPTG